MTPRGARHNENPLPGGTMEQLEALRYFFLYVGSQWVFVGIVFAALPGEQHRLRVTSLFAALYVVAMAIGAHALWLIVVEQSWVNHQVVGAADKLTFQAAHPSLKHLAADLLLLAQAGGLWGGPALVAVGGWLALGLIRMPVALKTRALKTLALATPFALGFAKLACFADGCCGGFSWDGPGSVEFFWIKGVDRRWFPTQLVDLALYVLVGLALLRHHRTGSANEQFGRFLMGYSTVRFATEFTRRDVVATWTGLTQTQHVVMLGLLVGAIVFVRPQLTTTWLSLRVSSPHTHSSFGGALLLGLMLTVAWLPWNPLILATTAAVLAIPAVLPSRLRRSAQVDLAICMGIALIWVGAYALPDLRIPAVALPVLLLVIGSRVDGLFHAH